jgi:hypothetical protein
MHRYWPMSFCLLALLLNVSPCAGQSGLGSFEIAQAGSRSAATAIAAGEQARSSQVNNWTVGLAGGFFEGTFIRFAVELAKALDDGENLRILPIVSYGGNENINDLLYLKGVDIAITYTDTFELYKKSERVRNIEQRINYISELLVGEAYFFARPEIRTLKDLEGKKVSLGTKGNSASTTGPIVFERLNIHPELIYVNNTIALEKMKTGEIAAIVSTGGKPNDLFVKLKPEPGFHFLSVEFSKQFEDFYLPCPLTHEDYPHLIAAGEAIDTLCMSAVLAVYNFPRGSDQARRIERFIQYYFERFERLKQPSFHPKWKEVNLRANVPGWNRYWLATEKLAAMPRPPTANSPTGPDRVSSSAVPPMDAAKQEALFQDFLTWQRKQGKGQ